MTDPDYWYDKGGIHKLHSQFDMDFVSDGQLIVLWAQHQAMEAAILARLNELYPEEYP